MTRRNSLYSKNISYTMVEEYLDQELEAAYYRSVQGKPHNYSKMAGMSNG